MKTRGILWLAIAGLAVAACTVNPYEDSLTLAQRKVNVTFNALQIEEGETKTVRNADKSVSWMPDDKINVICGSDRGMFTSTNTEASQQTSFSGELTEATINAINNGTNDPIWALYPYNENVETDGSTYVTTTLPSEQTGVAGTFADDLYISLAKSNNFNLSFYNVCSGFKFSVTKAGITSITIQGKNNEYIAGKVKLVFEDGKPKVGEVIEGQKTITLIPENSTFEVGKEYYFVTLPTSFSSGFNISLNTPSQTGSFNYDNPVNFPRSKFVTKAEIDDGINYEIKQGNITIPDANFKAYCVAKFDKNGDGEISMAEALPITAINCSSKSIQSLSGIEYFENMTSLGCSSNKLSNLNVSKNTALAVIDCSSNQITNLYVNENTLLTLLRCSDNQLTSIDVSKNTFLSELSCRGNQLTNLDVSKNTALTQLWCDNNHLTSLDVSKNTMLIFWGCNQNQLTSLDVTKNTALTQLWCSNNQLTSLDVSKNTLLTDLRCDNNQLTSLDVSKNSALTKLDCYDNQLTSLDVSKNSALTDLSCGSNQLTSIDVSKNSSLKSLGCYLNQLSSLDVSKNTALESLGCSKNQLTNLDVSNNIALNSLNCSSNLLTLLDVCNNLAMSKLNCTNNVSTMVIWTRPGQVISSFDYDYTATIQEKGDPISQEFIVFGDENFKAYCVESFDKNGDGEISMAEALPITTINCSSKSIQSLSGIEYFENITSLDCGNNQLTSIDVSKNTSLKMLWCNSNQLSSLDVSKNTALSGLYCSSNQLSILDVTKNTSLTELECYSNQLSTLDVSKNTALSVLYCSSNQLTSLDVSNNIALNWLYCSSNLLTSLDVSKNRMLTYFWCTNNPSLIEIWLRTEHSFAVFQYDTSVATIKYK